MSRHRATEHPALALMRKAAAGHLNRFRTDLTVHDALALSRHDPRDAFAWVLHSAATWLAFMTGTPPRRSFRFAGAFVEAYGADDCRYFFWDGTSLVRHDSAWALDERIEEYESNLREKVRAGELADRGIA